MTAPTHIIGGFVFAGTLCSFTDVNLFQSPQYIAVCAAVSILPDIDTTKSAIGKMFYPVAWLIYQKFGHRTITHSLLFFALVWTVMFALGRLGVVQDANYLKIVLFALLGHYVFDMITVSGVPLFYPFLKWSCVIPGNPSYRFDTSSIRGELVVCGICGILCFTMQPLFANGFWTSYNRQFGTVKHVDRENKNTQYYIICEYSYVMNAETIEGEAIVLDSKETELVLFDRRNVFVLNADNPQLKINHTRPRISTIEKRFEEVQFYGIGYDSLQNLLRGKLATGLIQSSKNIQYMDNSITYHTNFVKFTNRFDFQIFATTDSSKSTVQRSIARLEAAIAQSNKRHQSELAKYNDHVNSILALEDTLKFASLNNYERNKLQQELIRLRRRDVEKPTYNPPEQQIAELAVQRRLLIDNPLTFSGYMTVYTFGFDNSGTGINISIKPNYNPQVVFASLNPQTHENKEIR